jgi:hypothetical protein
MADTSKLTVATVQALTGNQLAVKIPVISGGDPDPSLGAGQLAYVDGALRVFNGSQWQGIDEGVSPVTGGLLFWVDAGNTESYPGSGSTWFNLAGTASSSIGDITLPGGYTYLPDSGGCFQFNGGQASSGNYSAGSNGITMEVVMYNTSTDTISTYGRIIDWNDTTVSYGSYASNQHRSWVNAGGSRMPGEYVVNSTSNGYYDKWNHTIMTYDGSTVKGYWNGGQAFSVAKTGNLESGNSPFTIGNGDAYAYYGKIAIVRIYNRGLTQAEVSQNYSSLKNRFNLGL